MSRGRRSAHSGATEDDRVAEARARGTFQREVSGLLLAVCHEEGKIQPAQNRADVRWVFTRTDPSDGPQW